MEAMSFLVIGIVGLKCYPLTSQSCVASELELNLVNTFPFIA